MNLSKTLTRSICSIQSGDDFTRQASNESGVLKICYNSGNDVMVVK